MADKTLEQMLEHLMNEDQATAEELFHEYVVKKSREIYEQLIETELSDDDEEVEESTKDDDEEVDEASKNESDDDDDEKVEESFGDEGDAEFGGDPTDDLVGDIDAGSDDEFGGDDEFGDDEFADKEPAELFQDLDSIVDELQAKFDSIAGGDEIDGDIDGEMPDDAFGSDNEEEIEDGFDQELATVREYVEKIGAPKMGDNGANTKSTVAGKNDMGGTSANILKGGEAKGEGTKGGLADPGTKEENAGNINVPGGKAGKAFSKKEPGHGAEKKGAAENAENKQSLFRNKR